jgi:hypothetical protein
LNEDERINKKITFIIVGLALINFLMPAYAALAKGYQVTDLKFEINALPKSLFVMKPQNSPNWLSTGTVARQQPVDVASAAVAQNLPETIYYLFKKSFGTDTDPKIDLQIDLWKYQLANGGELVARPAITMQDSQTTLWQVQGFQFQFILKLP